MVICPPFCRIQIMYSSLNAIYHILRRKFVSLTWLLRSFLSALRNSNLALSASMAPSGVPASLLGRSILCFVTGIFSSIITPEARSFSSALRCAFATLRRTFLDFAKMNQQDGNNRDFYKAQKWCVGGEIFVREGRDIQNSSPPAFDCALSSVFLSRHLHSHSGYSCSSRATGSSAFLR